MPEHEVTVTDIAARTTAVVAARTTWREFPLLWTVLLDEVWDCLRSQGIDSGCPNVMLYRDDVMHVEIGVELLRPCSVSGRVITSTLPAGRGATTVHRGSYDGLAAAHRAVTNHCAAEGLSLAGPRWEVYGPHHANPAEVTTEVTYLLSEQ